MLHDFLRQNRVALIERCRAKVARRPQPERSGAGCLSDGIPTFLDQVTKTLEVEQTESPLDSRKVSGPAGGGKPVLSEMGEVAARYGHELLEQGFSIDQVVHAYGDVCQAVTDLAVERGVIFTLDEFRTLNRCLDNAIADAVTEFSYRQAADVAAGRARDAAERLGYFAHELRNLLNNATLARTAMKTGNVGMSGATAGVLDRSLVALHRLVDQSLSEARIESGVPARHGLVSLAALINELCLSARLEAQTRGCDFTASAVERSLAVDVDPDQLLCAIRNLVQNAFKFTHPGSEVALHAYASADRILIDVLDHCGGLPVGDHANLFLPFTQTGTDHSGLGLGLSIARRAVESSRGTLGVRDVPGVGCVFTISLPRHQLPGAEAARPVGALAA